MRKLLASAIALAMFVPMASAGPPPPAPVDIDLAKNSHGPWTQSGSINMSVGQKYKSLFLRVKNRDAGKHATKFRAELSGYGIDDYKVKWFRGSKELDRVKVFGDSGYGFDLGGHETVKFEAKLKAKKANPDGLCMTTFVDVPPDGPYGNSVYVNDTSVCG
jgi:hypothetical protein